MGGETVVARDSSRGQKSVESLLDGLAIPSIPLPAYAYHLVGGRFCSCLFKRRKAVDQVRFLRAPVEKRPNVELVVRQVLQL